MNNIFNSIKNSQYTSISVPFSNENKQEIEKYIKELSSHNIVHILDESYSDFVVIKTELFEDIVTNFDSDYYKWLENKKEKERQVAYKDKLEIEKSEREVDKLKYEKANQELDKTIKILTAKNLRLQNFQIIYGLVGAVLGFVGAFLSEHWFGLIRILIKHLIK